MLSELSKGALDRIMSGEEIDQPILQFLRHKKVVNSTSDERYRLLMSDGVKSCLFVMLVFQLNELITKGVMSDYSIVQIKSYATVMSNVTGGIRRRVMVILDMEILVPGHEVGKVLGSVSFANAGAEEAGSDAACHASAAPPPRPVRNQQVAPKASSRAGKIYSIGLFLIVIVAIITLLLLQLTHPII